MNELRYALIRFVPDMARMEPINVGVILQGQGRIDFKLSPHAAKRKDVDTPVFQRWRTFFEEEISGEAVPLLQPPKDSSQFLTHLAGLCEHTVAISKPLALGTEASESFDATLQSLYERLVAPVEQAKGRPLRPTAQFRRMAEDANFLKRGMKKHPYLVVDEGMRWNAYRQATNGANIVIDKIEVGSIIGYTADEIQKLSGVECFLRKFFRCDSSDGHSQYVLIADELTEKFTDQSEEDFDVMRDELKKVMATVREVGGSVLSTTKDVHDFAIHLDTTLPPLTE